MSAFPQYRKYSNNKSYFKIHSETLFDELQLMGDTCFSHRIEAKIYPDRLRIMDMMACKDEIWLPCSADEYETVVSRCS